MGIREGGMRNQGWWDEAENLQVDVVNGTEAMLGSNHPGTLSSIVTIMVWTSTLCKPHTLDRHCYFLSTDLI